MSCPYQTPSARILRHIPLLGLSVLRSVTSNSQFTLSWFSLLKEPRYSARNLIQLPILPLFMAFDAYALVQAMVRAFVAIVRRVYNWFRGTCGSDLQTTALDLRCISWMLQTSLDKAIHLLTLKLLASVTAPLEFDPALVSACFDVLAGCVSIIGNKVVIAPGSEEVGVASALCCLRELSHPTTMEPTSSVFKYMQQRYTREFPIEANLEALPSYHHFCIIHNIFYPSRKWSRSQGRDLHRPKIQWKNYKLSGSELTILTEFARSEYERQNYRKVPRWILRFAHCQLSQDPLPPARVVTDCLFIISMGLGCHVILYGMTLDERYAHIQ